MKKTLKTIVTISLLLLATVGLWACNFLEETEESSEIVMVYDSDEPDTSGPRIIDSSSKTMYKGSLDGWTIFVYLCGTDLESESEVGTGDLAEMLDATPSDSVRFAVQTGGTEYWANDLVDPSKTQRFLVQNSEITLVDETQDLQNMGDPDTLEEFVSWGIDNYGAEHNGLVFWDHGGGSITGVCMDEEFDYDSLSLRDIDTALSAPLGEYKIDFIGFDACLMGTLETANLMSAYATYMYGSEETEPGSGWDYTSIGSFLAKNPNADALELGKAVCDSYYAACKKDGEEYEVTLSVMDLSKVADLVIAFDKYCENLCGVSQDDAARASIIRNICSAKNFGGNNKAEGYTNMVDVGGFIQSGADYATGADEVLKAIESLVVYSVRGEMHATACGVSMYYPLSIQGSEEIKIFKDISPSGSYNNFITNKTDGHDGNGAVISGEETGKSEAITFSSEPALNEDGIYGFTLDENGLNNTAGVCAFVYQMTEDGETLIELGETSDVYANWETGEFEDYFDGYWLSLPDGQNLALYLVEEGEDYVVYASPILLNGDLTYLRIRQSMETGETTVEGAWDGIDENGIASRDIYKLKNGDVIGPYYYAYNLNTDEELEYTGYEYTVSGTLQIDYDVMDDGDYMYSFCIDDIYGDYYETDPVMFNIENGEVGFYED